MTLSSRTHTETSIKTLINLSTCKRTFMLLYNPDEIHRADWYVHISFFGLSLVYFSVNTPDASFWSADCPEEIGSYSARFMAEVA